MTPQQRERRARAAHVQAVAIYESVAMMPCPTPGERGRGNDSSCAVCRAIRAAELLRTELARLY